MTNLGPIQSTSLANYFDLPHFVLTAPVKRIVDLCQILQQTRTLGLLLGPPGVGKTWAVQYAAQNQPQPAEFSASPVLYTSVDVNNTTSLLLSNILDCLGPNYRTPISDLSRTVCAWIHRRQVALIILDEADRLDKTSWELIRDLHERTRCAFLLVGQPDLTYRLRTKEPLLNRVSLTIEMPPLLFNELIEFLCAWQVDRFYYTPLQNSAQFCIIPDDPDHLKMLKQIYQVTLGNMRRVCYFIQEAERIATLNGQKFVELSVVQATAELLVNTIH